MDRRRFLKSAAGLFVPAAPAILLPKLVRAQGGMGPGPGMVHSTGGGSTTTLNPADKSASVTLSGGNLTATGSGSNGLVRGTTSSSSGKFYCEFTPTNITNNFQHGLGVSNAGAAYASNFTVVLYNGSANVETNGVAGSSVGFTYTVSDVVSMAIDLTNNTVWYRKNGGDWNGNPANDPTTNTGGIAVTTSAKPAFVYVSCGNVAANAKTINFGGSAYSFTPPSGFGNW